MIKIPYGHHIRTNEQSCFLDDSGNPIADVNGFLDNLSKNSLSAVKKVLAKNMGMPGDMPMGKSAVDLFLTILTGQGKSGNIWTFRI